MSIEVCPTCTCRFAVGLPHCPHCHTIAPLFADHANKDETVPRITTAEGPSNAKAQPGEPGYTGGSDTPSAGTSSSTFDARPEPSSNETPTLSDPPPPAPSTENPSSPDPRPNPASGSADSTDGSTPETGSAPSRRRDSSMGSRKARARTADSRNSDSE